MLWSQIIYGHRRQEESYDLFLYKFLDIVRCPVKFRYCFRHRSVSGLRLHTSDGHLIPGIVRCLTSAGYFKNSLNKSADARPGTGRCPSGHRPMFYESNLPPVRSDVFLQRNILHVHIYFISKDQKHKYK